MKKFAVADLFSGCGGFSLGFSRDENFQVNFAVDNWEVALETLARNQPNTKCIQTDLSEEANLDALVRQLNGEVDVLLGGPPCQGFSTLGKRRDGDRRSTLVDTFAEICLKTRPKIAIVENVRGITTKRHPSHGTYANALLGSLGGGEAPNYICSAQTLNAVDFGVPQSRIRWFMFAVRADIASAPDAIQTFWQSVNKSKRSHQRTLRDALGDLPEIEAGEAADFIKSGMNSARLFNHKAMSHSPALIERLRHIPPGGGLPDVPRELLTPHLKKMLDGGYGSGGHVKNIYGRMPWDKPAGTIVAGIDKITCGRFVHPEKNRLLTPRECARLQSFPDDYAFSGGQVAQYYQIGNAVPPGLGEVLANSTAEALAVLTGRLANKAKNIGIAA